MAVTCWHLTSAKHCSEMLDRGGFHTVKLMLHCTAWAKIYPGETEMCRSISTGMLYPVQHRRCWVLLSACMLM